MPDDFIGIAVQETPEFSAFLANAPAIAQDAAIDAANEYLLNVLKAYPPQRSITRKEAYGVSFFTEKQRRWFFANLDNLQIPYHRTQYFHDG